MYRLSLAAAWWVVIGLSGCGDRATPVSQAPTKNGPEDALAAGMAGSEWQPPDAARRDGDVRLCAIRDLQQFRFSAAERSLRTALDEHPDDVTLQLAMANLLVTQGRRWDAQQHLLQLIKSDQFRVQELMWLGNPDEPFDNEEVILAALDAVPEDPLPLLGRARVAIRRNQHAEAVELLRKVLAVHPGLPEAQAQLGAALNELGETAAFLEWKRDLPESATSHPDTWFVLGRWCAENNQPRAAVRCFWEAVRRDPNHLRACYQLGLTLQNLGETASAHLFLERARQLTLVHDTVYSVMFRGLRKEWATEMARAMESLGRLWEARAWSIAVLSTDRGNPDAQASRDRLTALLKRDNPPQTLPSANPANQVDLSAYPLPRSPDARGTLPAAQAIPSITFEDMATEAGVDFTFFDSSTTKSQPGHLIFETTGGGVAVLDYDSDGWPDIYFTQCCPWPPSPGQSTYRDRLFRNLGHGHFEDVTNWAGLGDSDYSQGVTVGDFDNDGLPDLYVANIGQNRLYHNNGDGTFDDVTASSGIRDGQWTTSCLMADLNGDGAADIYDVNYVDDDDVFVRLCGENRNRVCHPNVFQSAQGQLFLSQGDGTCAMSPQKRD